MKIKEMTDLHIKNHINWLKRNLDEKPDPIFESCDDSDGVWHSLRCESMANDMIEADILDHIEELQEELDSRLIANSVL